MTEREDWTQTINIDSQTLTNVDTNVTVEQARSVEDLSKTTTGNIADTEDEFVEFAPPAGSIYRLISASAVVDDTGGSETHFLALGTGQQATQRAVNAQFNGTDFIELEGNVILNLSSAVDVDPKTHAAQVANLKGYTADSDSPFVFEYANFSGQTQTKDREYSVKVEKVQIA